MDNDQNQDSLVLIPPEKWGDLEEEFKRDWPRSIAGYRALETQRDWLKRGIRHEFSVYCPYGDVKNGMVAIQTKDLIKEAIIQCASDDTSKLAQALKRTKRIQWNRRFVIPCPPIHITRCIHSILDDINMKIAMDGTPHEMFVLSKDTPMFEDIRLPQGLTFGLLTEEHIEAVDSVWPNRYKGSDLYFKFIFEAQNGYGLFKDGQLACCVSINEIGFILHLFTMQNFRRKGYAEILMKLVCNTLLKEQRDAYLFVKKGLDSAYSLYEKLGFKKYHTVLWGFLEPKTSKL